MHDEYIEVIALIERLHRNFLEVVKGNLDRLGSHDINAVQALMLFNMGGAEMSVGELILRGCYLGANVPYNVKKLVETGHLSQERSVYDRRRSRVRLTNKGAKLRDRLQSMHERHSRLLEDAALGSERLQATAATLRRLESFWSDVRG
jgi:DNA-binding MarR family transcriptional regulator